MIPLQRVVPIWSEIRYYWVSIDPSTPLPQGYIHMGNIYLWFPIVLTTLYTLPLYPKIEILKLFYHMPEFWSVMKKGSKSIIRSSGGSIWKQWERNLWRCRAAFIFLSNIFMSQAWYWTTFRNEPVNMGSIRNSMKYWKIKNHCCFSCWSGLLFSCAGSEYILEKGTKCIAPERELSTRACRTPASRQGQGQDRIEPRSDWAKIRLRQDLIEMECQSSYSVLKSSNGQTRKGLLFRECDSPCDGRGLACQGK